MDYVILEFSILRRKIAKFRKIRIFELNGAVYFSTVKKFHTRGLDLNNKEIIWAILEFSILSGKIAEFGKKFGFLNLTLL